MSLSNPLSSRKSHAAAAAAAATGEVSQEAAVRLEENLWEHLGDLAAPPASVLAKGSFIQGAGAPEWCYPAWVIPKNHL